MRPLCPDFGYIRESQASLNNPFSPVNAMKPSTEAMIRMDNLRHFFQRGPGGSTVYTCRCGAQEKYTSADTICGIARTRAVKLCLLAFQIPFEVDKVNCKGGEVTRFLVELPKALGPGKEAFAPWDNPVHTLELWERLPEARKDFIRGQMCLRSGDARDRFRHTNRLTLSQAAYQAQEMKELIFDSAFSRWLSSESPSGDSDQVHSAWVASTEYAELLDKWTTD